MFDAFTDDTSFVISELIRGRKELNVSFPQTFVETRIKAKSVNIGSLVKKPLFVIQHSAPCCDGKNAFNPSKRFIVLQVYLWEVLGC